eukprot:TRINITY_DN1025_c0_g1_i1.p1 TRINITY_DN1025_c0_g1~~TRINITY_DN1025_c0_g1_i1.p1  ORF type:complete len:868 (+),score=164.17 TRINITY_DN1025_c0_g1_i1:273-2876(+)
MSAPSTTSPGDVSSVTTPMSSFNVGGAAVEKADKAGRSTTSSSPSAFQFEFQAPSTTSPEDTRTTTPAFSFNLGVGSGDGGGAADSGGGGADKTERPTSPSPSTSFQFQFTPIPSDQLQTTPVSSSTFPTPVFQCQSTGMEEEEEEEEEGESYCSDSRQYAYEPMPAEQCGSTTEFVRQVIIDYMVKVKEGERETREETECPSLGFDEPRLVDAEVLASSNPTTFLIPTAEERSHLLPGTLVDLLIPELECNITPKLAEVHDGALLERISVVVVAAASPFTCDEMTSQSIDNEGGAFTWYLGAIVNEPHALKEKLTASASEEDDHNFIRFEPRHVSRMNLLHGHPRWYCLDGPMCNISFEVLSEDKPVLEVRTHWADDKAFVGPGGMIGPALTLLSRVHEGEDSHEFDIKEALIQIPLSVVFVRIPEIETLIQDAITHPTHHFTTCKTCGSTPIVGARHHHVKLTHDLCSKCFEELTTTTTPAVDATSRDEYLTFRRQPCGLRYTRKAEATPFRLTGKTVGDDDFKHINMKMECGGPTCGGGQITMADDDDSDEDVLETPFLLNREGPDYANEHLLSAASATLRPMPDFLELPYVPKYLISSEEFTELTSERLPAAGIVTGIAQDILGLVGFSTIPIMKDRPNNNNSDDNNDGTSVKTVMTHTFTTGIHFSYHIPNIVVRGNMNPRIVNPLAFWWMRVWSKYRKSCLAAERENNSEPQPRIHPATEEAMLMEARRAIKATPPRTTEAVLERLQQEPFDDMLYEALAERVVDGGSARSGDGDVRVQMKLLDMDEEVELLGTLVGFTRGVYSGRYESKEELVADGVTDVVEFIFPDGYLERFVVLRRGGGTGVDHAESSSKTIAINASE